MPKVTVVREQPTLPPIQTVVLELTENEALVLAGLLGQFGAEYHTDEIYHALRHELNIGLMSDTTSSQNYRTYGEKAKNAIRLRANLL